VSAESELAKEFEALAQRVDQRLRELKERLERRAEELKRSAFQGSER
jgi:cell division protein ZapA (FtsZ GTPase activity inhibitor)